MATVLREAKLAVSVSQVSTWFLVQYFKEEENEQLGL